MALAVYFYKSRSISLLEVNDYGLPDCFRFTPAALCIATIAILNGQGSHSIILGYAGGVVLISQKHNRYADLCYRKKKASQELCAIKI